MREEDSMTLNTKSYVRCLKNHVDPTLPPYTGRTYVTWKKKKRVLSP